MPIIQLQRRLAEIGRIRLGQQVQSKGGKKHPAALDTFRLTSTDRDRIVEAADLYGGTPTRWDGSPSGRAQWECITKADKLPVVVPPSAMAFSQSYELWSAGGCQRRCDGVTERIGEQPCLCDPDERLCEIHTRLSVMLRDMRGLGVWRVDTQGFYAAVEIQGAVEIIELAAGRGQMLPATLRLDHREIKRPDDPVKRFVVPVLDIDVSPAQLLMGTIAVTEPKQAALTPVPAGDGPASIADQVAASEDLPSRRRSEPIKGTGIAPRTALQAREATRSRVSGDPWPAVEADRAAGGDDPERGGGARFGTNDGPLPDEAKRYIEDEAKEQREAIGPDEAEQLPEDAPRMATRGQLTKLGILLTARGFKSKTEEGKRRRMEFCMDMIGKLLPDAPTSSRTIESSTELTFDEVHKLIEWLEAQARKPLITDHGFTPAAVDETGMEPIDYCVAGVGGGELCGEPRSRHANAAQETAQPPVGEREATPEAGPEAEEPAQMDMLDAEPPPDPWATTETQQRRIDENVARGYDR